MQNVNHKTILFHFVHSNKEKKGTNETKLSLKLIKKSLIYLLGDETANHVNLM